MMEPVPRGSLGLKGGGHRVAHVAILLVWVEKQTPALQF